MKYWVPVFLWMLVIFGASTDLGSTRHTSRIIGPVLRWFKPDISEQTIGSIQTVFRKCGHMAEYAILAMLVWRARFKPRSLDERSWSWQMAGFAVVVAFLYAISDEFHQSFVKSRQGSVADVGLDTVGAVLGVAILYAIWRCQRRSQFS